MTLLSRIIAGAAIIAIFGLAVAGPPIARAGFGPFLGGGVAIAPPPIGLNHKGIDDYYGPIGYGGLASYEAELSRWQGIGNAWGRATVAQSAEDPSCTGTANINAATSGGVSDAAVFTTAQNYGVTILYDLAGSASCNKISNCSSQSNQAWSCPPSNYANWAAFAGSFAGQAADIGAHYYEIWNEEAAVWGWSNPVTPADYTSMLCQAYTQIHSHDPQAVVIIGGMNATYANGGYPGSTTNALDARYFFQQIYANSGGNCFDAVGMHPYATNPYSYDGNCTLGNMTLRGECGNYEWDEIGGTVPDGYPDIEAILTSEGQSSKKIWVTEVGCNTNTSSGASYCSAAAQATYITDIYTQSIGGFGGTFMGPIIYWDDHDASTACTTPGVDCSGLYTSGGTAKSGGTAFAAASGTW